MPKGSAKVLTARGLIKSKRFRNISREGLWIFSGHAVAVLGTLFGIRLLTGLLSPVAYGELALGITLANFVNQTVSGPLSAAACRFYAPSFEKGELSQYLQAIRRLVLSTTGFVLLLMLLLIIGFGIIGQTKWIGIATAALIFAAFSGLNLILSGIQNAARQRSIVALHQGVDPWARFLVAAGFLLWIGATSTMAMVGYSFAAILVLGSQYLFLKKINFQGTENVKKGNTLQEQMWEFIWPMSIFGIFTWIQLISDRWALELMSGTQDVGFYAVLFQLGYMPMYMITGMAMQFVAPIYYQLAGDATDSQRNANVNKLNKRFTGLGFLLTGMAFLLGSVFHIQIFRIFVAPEYASVSHLLPWMVLAGGFFSVGQILSLNLMSQMKTRDMMLAKIITALLGVALNFAGAYWYGIKGVVGACVVFSIIYFLSLAFILRKGNGGLSSREGSLSWKGSRDGR
jgi:O-antigen/teichoic acid export membrane protein